ncbi:mediator of RNA polymerase II transcription subunit [Trifolium repens]|nr:mediator of RNA polymerase II transcription subunit [Trifolium repens]
MAEGLAEALVMYPKPCDTMTEREYYNAERHCILVAPGDPVPKRMPVCVPMIQRAQLIGQRLQACNADFLEVAQKFVPLAVSLSVITPNSVPIFGAIFNMHWPIHCVIIKNFKEAHNALQGKTIVESPSTTPVESNNAEADTTLFNVLNLQGEHVSAVASEAMIGEQIQELSNAVMPDNVSAAKPHDSSALIFSTDPENVASPSSEIRINLFDDFMNDLDNDEDIFSPNKRSKTFVTETELINFLELNENPFGSFNDSLGQDEGVSADINQISVEEVLKGYENELGEALNAAPRNTSNDQTFSVELTASSSKNVNIPPEQVQVPEPEQVQVPAPEQVQVPELEQVQVPPPEQVQAPALEQVQVPVSNTGEGSSRGLLHGLTLESWYNPQALMNTSTLNFQNFPTGVSNSNFTFFNVTGNSQMEHQQNSSLTNLPMQYQQNSSLGNSSMQFQQNSSLGSLQMQQLQHNSPQTQFSMFPNYSRGLMGNFAGEPIGQNLESYNQYLRNNNIGGYTPPAFGESTWLRTIPSVPFPYLSSNLYVPSISELENYIHTWDGSVAGKINSCRFTVMKAKAYRRTTSQITLTFRWGNRLDISHFIPQKAVSNTKRFSAPLDYVFFHVMKHNNVDLYKHLKNRYLGAKIDLQYQTIILTPAEREHYYVGTIFPSDTLFIEQQYL